MHTYIQIYIHTSTHTYYILTYIHTYIILALGPGRIPVEDRDDPGLRLDLHLHRGIPLGVQPALPLVPAHPFAVLGL